MATLIYVMKQFLLVFFVLHTIFGLMVLCGGTAYLMVIPTINRFGFNTGALNALAIFFIIFGILCIVTVCFGCYGLFRESFRYLLVISIILAVGWVFQCYNLIHYLLGSYEMIRKEDKPIIKNRLMQNDTSRDLEVLQSAFGCCGFDSPNDWKDYGYKQVPETCCYNVQLKNEKTNSECTKHYQHKRFMYPDGCYEILNASYKKRSRILAIAFIVVVVIETMGVAFAFALTFLIRKRNLAEGPPIAYIIMN